MSYSFSQLQDIKARVVRDLAAQQAAQKSHEAGFEAVDVALSNMQTTYTEWAADINSYIAANPTNPAAMALKAEKDALVAEFASLRTRAQAASAAIGAL